MLEWPPLKRDYSRPKATIYFPSVTLLLFCNPRKDHSHERALLSLLLVCLSWQVLVYVSNYDIIGDRVSSGRAGEFANIAKMSGMDEDEISSPPRPVRSTVHAVKMPVTTAAQGGISPDEAARENQQVCLVFKSYCFIWHLFLTPDWLKVTGQENASYLCCTEWLLSRWCCMGKLTGLASVLNSF